MRRKTVSQLSGQNIPFAAKVSFGGVIKITDAIGGVEVCIGNGGIRDKLHRHRLAGRQPHHAGHRGAAVPAHASRPRNGSDLARISNQQQYMSRLARKLVSEEVLSNPATLYKLATTAVDNITPSRA